MRSHSTRHVLTDLANDRHGNVAAGYLFVIAMALAWAVAVGALSVPVRTLNALARSTLAENNP